MNELESFQLRLHSRFARPATLHSNYVEAERLRPLEVREPEELSVWDLALIMDCDFEDQLYYWPYIFARLAEADVDAGLLACDMVGRVYAYRESLTSRSIFEASVACLRWLFWTWLGDLRIREDAAHWPVPLDGCLARGGERDRHLESILEHDARTAGSLLEEWVRGEESLQKSVHFLDACLRARSSLNINGVLRAWKTFQECVNDELLIRGHIERVRKGPRNLRIVADRLIGAMGE